MENTSNKCLRDYTRNTDFDLTMEANPNHLITLLLESAIEKVSFAINSHNEQQWTKKGFYIGRTTIIVDSLNNRLDLSMGEIANDFELFYAKIDESLQTAVMDDTVAPLEEVQDALVQIRNLWIEMIEVVDVEPVNCEIYDLVSAQMEYAA